MSIDSIIVEEAMGTNEDKIMPVLYLLFDKIQNGDFVVDKTGVKMVELLAPRIELNPMQPELNFFDIRKTPKNYCEKEIKWYDTQDLSIIGHVDDIAIWKNVATKDGNFEINSNYGWCIYSEENYNQYDNCIEELKKQKDSRRAVMIYNRPSMWIDYNRNGMNDFMCTLAVQIMIRNNQLFYIINQRSLDVWFSFLGSDLYWHCVVYQRLLKELQLYYPELQIGCLIWVANSFHLYERHFESLKKIINLQEKSLKKPNTA